MSQALSTEPRTTLPSPVIPELAPPSVTAPSAVEPTIARQIISKVKSAPWMLALLAPIGAAPLYVSSDAMQYGFGLSLACVPILAAAAFLLTGMLTCVFFLDDTH